MGNQLSPTPVDVREVCKGLGADRARRNEEMEDHAFVTVALIVSIRSSSNTALEQRGHKTL